MRNVSCNYQIFLAKEERVKNDKKYWVYRFKDGHTKRVLSFLKFGTPIELELVKDEKYKLSGKINNVYGNIFLTIENISIDTKNYGK